MKGLLKVDYFVKLFTMFTSNRSSYICSSVNFFTKSKHYHRSGNSIDTLYILVYSKDK